MRQDVIHSALELLSGVDFCSSGKEYRIAAFNFLDKSLYKTKLGLTTSLMASLECNSARRIAALRKSLLNIDGAELAWFDTR